jgi:hypothetical protein
MNKPTLIICLCLLGIFAACVKSYDCKRSEVFLPSSIAFKGFTSSDIDTIDIRSYNPNAKFDSLTRHIVFHPAIAQQNHDTIVLKITDSATIRPATDYDIFIPRRNVHFLITNVVGQLGMKEFTYSYHSNQCPENPPVVPRESIDSAIIDAKMIKPILIKPWGDGVILLTK